MHLKHRDTTMIAASRAPLKKLQAFKKRMGWSFNWVSSYRRDFNFDLHVSFRPKDLKQGNILYNFTKREVPCEKMVGIRVFRKGADGTVFHTYSTYSRGVDMLKTAYHYLDLTPKGRDEAGLKAKHGNPHPNACLPIRQRGVVITAWGFRAGGRQRELCLPSPRGAAESGRSCCWRDSSKLDDCHLLAQGSSHSR